MAEAEKSPDDLARLAIMEMAEQLAPIHEFVTGEAAHYVRQGFTGEQARAIVAAEFSSIFGSRIEAAAARPEEH